MTCSRQRTGSSTCETTPQRRDQVRKRNRSKRLGKPLLTAKIVIKRRLGDPRRFDDLADRGGVVTLFRKKTSGRARDVARHRAQLFFLRGRGNSHVLVKQPRMPILAADSILPSGRYCGRNPHFGQVRLLMSPQPNGSGPGNTPANLRKDANRGRVDRRDGWGSSSPQLIPGKPVVLVPYYSAIEKECEEGLRALVRAGVAVSRFSLSAIDLLRNAMLSDALHRGLRPVSLHRCRHWL